MDRFERRTTSEEQTDALGRCLARCLGAGDVVVLEGTLGAGKTAFVRAVAYGLGLPEDEPVTSPSFAVVQEYETTPRLLHADLYRLAHSDELLQLGLGDAVDAGAVAFVEWGLGHVDALDRVDLVVAIAGSGDEPRTFDAVAKTNRGKSLLDAWCGLASADCVW